MSILATVFAYVSGITACIAICGIVVYLGWHLARHAFERAMLYAEMLNRRELSSQIEHCMLAVRDNDNPRLMMHALTELLRDDSRVSPAYLRSVYERLKRENQNENSARR